MYIETILIFGIMFALVALQVILQWNQTPATKPWFLRKMIYDSLWLVFMVVLGVRSALTDRIMFTLLYFSVTAFNAVSVCRVYHRYRESI